MKRILVTGANKGIGRAIVEAILAEHDDTHVLLGSRSPERGDTSRAELLRDHPGWADRLDVVTIDVADDGSVAGAAADVASRFAPDPRPLYGIVNNAGIGLGAAHLRAVLEVNTFGVHRVCEAFLPLLDPSSGRIVNVTSAAGPSFVSQCSPEKQRFFLDASIDWPVLSGFLDECLAVEGGEAGFQARGLGNGGPYGLSKASTNLYTLVLARENPGLKINACTPGFIETDLTRPRLVAAGATAAQAGMKSPAEGARSVVHLLFADLDGTGRYYGSDARRSPLDRYREPGSPAYAGD